MIPDINKTSRITKKLYLGKKKWIIHAPNIVNNTSTTDILKILYE